MTRPGQGFSRRSWLNAAESARAGDRHHGSGPADGTVQVAAQGRRGRWRSARASRWSTSRRRADRGTLCISSQVGCVLDCSLLLDGAAGLQPQPDDGRDRRPGAGWPTANWASSAGDSPRIITNVVLMGMGEPLANFRNVVPALHIFLDDLGLRPVATSRDAVDLRVGAADPQARRSQQRRAGGVAACTRRRVAQPNWCRSIKLPSTIAELLEACWALHRRGRTAAASPSNT